LEALVIEEYRAKRLSHAQLRRILSLSRFQVEGLLQAHGVWLDYSIDDFHQKAGSRTRQPHRQSLRPKKKSNPAAPRHCPRLPGRASKFLAT
jgi:hypothetical protein